MIGRRIGRYRVIAPLGQGGIASVWKARDELLNRTVAVKVLDPKLATSPQARRRFLHDAQAAGHLSHPGVIAVHDSGESEGTVYIVLALVDGETVSERAARRLMPFDEVIRIAIAAADALAHAHEHEVIHRDVTGRNLMVARDGRVIVLDFGLALAAWESRVTTTDTAMGTAPYMAPELFEGDAASERSNVYGLGVVMYEMLTGAMPFGGEHPQAVVYAAMNLPPASLRERRPDVPADLEEIVLRAMARDPAARFESAATLAAALRALDSGAASGGVDETVKHGRGNGAAPPAPADRPSAPSPLYLAIMPFETEASADPDDACRTLAGRLGETVSCALAKTTTVRVVAPAQGPWPADPREAARQLGANAVLRGTVRRNGSQMRVSYAVLDPFRGVQIAGDVLDGSAMRVFDVEDQVVASVTRALERDRTAETKAARPLDPAAHDRYLQALGYLKRYDNEASVDGAIQILEKLAGAHDDVAAYHAALTRAYLHKYELTKERVWESKAAASGERARTLDPDAPEVLVARGVLHMSAGHHDDACREFEAALRASPDDIDAHLGLARAHRAAGRLGAAEEACRRAVHDRPDDWRGHLLLGQIHYKGGAFAEALGPWQRVLELTPDNAMGRRYLGSALYHLDRHEEAITAYRESIAIQPNDEAYTNLGTALYYLGSFEDSVAALRKSVELTPSDPWRWGNLGNACRWIPGREAESRQALETAVGLMRERIDRNPVHAEWWARMAGWLANLGDAEQARASIAEALKLGPDDVHCMVRAVHVYGQLGDREECLRWLRRARGAGYGTTELRRSRELAPLWEDPEFKALLDQGSDAGESDGGDQTPTQ